ncbi:MAG: PIN domain-containing protein [Acidobacteria bacterium]|nr:PIN domain-containing protein [Acidobacteriota bacterium]
MIAYVDSSVVLRLVLGQPGGLSQWKEIRRGVSSSLIEVECLRTIDRFRMKFGLSDKDHARRRSAVYAIIDEIDIVEITRPVLSRASQPMPTVVGTLDAIHLATAVLWSEQSAERLVVATHDGALGRAAEAFGFEVIGTE